MGHEPAHHARQVRAHARRASFRCRPHPRRRAQRRGCVARPRGVLRRRRLRRPRRRARRRPHHPADRRLVHRGGHVPVARRLRRRAHGPRRCSPPASAVRTCSASTPRRGPRSRASSSTYRAHLSGAASWAVPTFVVEAGHRGALGVHPRRRARPPRRRPGRPRGPTGPAATPTAPTRCGSASAASSRARAWRAASRGRASTPRGDLTDERAPAVGVIGARRAPPRRRSRSPCRRETRAAACSSARSTSTAGGSRARGCARRCPPLSARGATSPAACRARSTRPRRSGSTPATVADGPHTLVARAEDVAGNARTASAAILVDNLPPRAGPRRAERRRRRGA